MRIVRQIVLTEEKIITDREVTTIREVRQTELVVISPDDPEPPTPGAFYLPAVKAA